MHGLVWALAGAGILLLAAVLTGWWRYAFAPFQINTSRMTVRKLGLDVTDPTDIERVDNILDSFLTGFNRMIARPSPSAWKRYCESLSPLMRPFAEEGAAMGYTLRRLFRYDPAHFEATIVKPRPGFRYLYYVGLGFWSGMRNHSAAKVARIVRGLDPLHSYLVYDGYGFKVAFFDYPKDPQAFRVLDTFDAYGRNAAYQGAGRALHFLYMGNFDAVIEHMARLGPHAVDAAAGVGLAASFVNPDRLEREFDLGRRMPVEWQPHFHLGMCFGLKARAINDLDEFDRNLAALPHTVQEAIRASIRECDRVELLIRADGKPDGYRHWREQVTAWLTENVDFPMQSTKGHEATRPRVSEAVAGRALPAKS